MVNLQAGLMTMTHLLTSRKVGLSLLLSFCAGPLIILAAPSWWTDRGAMDNFLSAEDDEAINIGQLQHMASIAYDENVTENHSTEDVLAFLEVPERMTPFVTYSIVLSYVQELVQTGKYVAVDLLDPENDWTLHHRELVPLLEDQVVGEVVVDFSFMDPLPERKGYVLHAFIAPNGMDFSGSTARVERELEIWRDPQRLINGELDMPVAYSDPNAIPFWSSRKIDSSSLDTTIADTAPLSLMLDGLGETIWQSTEVLPNRELVLAGRLLRPSPTAGNKTLHQQGILSLQFFDITHQYISEKQTSITSEDLDDQWQDISIVTKVPEEARSATVSLHVDGSITEESSDSFNGAGNTFDENLWTQFGDTPPYRVDGTAYFPAQRENWSAGGIMGDKMPPIPIHLGVEAQVTILGADPMQASPFQSISYFDMMLTESPNGVADALTSNLAVLRLHVTENNTYFFELGVKTNDFHNGNPGEPFWLSSSSIPGVSTTEPLVLTLRMTLDQVEATFTQNNSDLLVVNYPVAFGPSLSESGVGPVLYQANLSSGRAAFRVDNLVLSRVGEPGPIHFDSLQVVTSIDSDGDRMPDWWETAYGFNPDHFLQPNPEDDADSDGVSNLSEYWWLTDPVDADTDADGMSDGWEIDHGLNATDPGDAHIDRDYDGLTNVDEFQIRTDPSHYNTDLDGDGVSDVNELHETFTDPRAKDFATSTLR